MNKELTYKIIGAAMQVHTELGPGLLESTYENCLEDEFNSQKIKCERQRLLPVFYKGKEIECGYRLDFIGSCCINHH